MVDRMLASELEAEEVGRMLALYLSSRVNKKVWEEEGVVQPLDTTTYDFVWSKLTKILGTETNYKLTDPAFDVARGIKAAYMKKAKAVAGLGELAHQAKPLTSAQVII